MGAERKSLSEEAWQTEHLSHLKGWGKKQRGESRLVLFEGPGGGRTSQEAAEVILGKDGDA